MQRASNSSLRRRRTRGPDSREPAGTPGNEVSRGPRTEPAAGAPRKGSKVKRAALVLFSRYNKLEGWTPNIVTAAFVVLFTRIAAAILSGIADCDETYNYWEPLHYLVYGYGFEAWEYSPKFGLRSYAFLAPFFGISSLIARSSVPLDYDARVLSFFAVRIFLAVMSTAADLYLYDSTIWRFGKAPARLLLVFLVAAPGTFRASVELLPSSFSMICFSAFAASWMVGEYRRAIGLLALASLLGWPYTVVIGIPMAAHVVYRKGITFFLAAGIPFGCLLLLIIVKGAGSEIFGVEDWTYYALNLVLNFNVASAFACLSPALWLLQSLGLKIWSLPQAFSRVIFLSPCWIWLAIFCSVPHKEERFLAPIYPFLLLTAAVSLNDTLRYACGIDIVDTPEPAAKEQSTSSSDRADEVPAAMTTIARRKRSEHWTYAYFAMSFAAVVVFVALSISRTYAVVDYFNAPFKLFQSLSRHELQGGIGPRASPSNFADGEVELNLCIGKEWYRFPTSFFLPGRRFRLRFTRSTHSGLLPKYFKEDENGTKAEPEGMNMFNKEDPTQYLENPHLNCHYFIDLQLPDDNPRENPIPVEDRMILFREEFVSVERSNQPFRSFYIPWVSEAYIYRAPYLVIRNLKALPLTS
ncbi:hypothetical protein NDN08_004561 [Rhodosorus marinus]|uniref:Mannosyltransferase n=1 Tax=Rhodosorus marinus TaxID=101924 RepID=A0AAV8ULL8_9RHOD|nr:hypothetical protein NDN08_004561 [Rhodosorus marinus]